MRLKQLLDIFYFPILFIPNNANSFSTCIIFFFVSILQHECPFFNTDFFPAKLKKQETETFSYYCGDSKRFSSEKEAIDYRNKGL